MTTAQLETELAQMESEAIRELNRLKDKYGIHDDHEDVFFFWLLGLGHPRNVMPHYPELFQQEYPELLAIVVVD